MTDNIVDLAAERAQRSMLADHAAAGGDAFVRGLQLAGRTLADLGWLLAAPIRGHDKELTQGIYQLTLQRLGRIIEDAVSEGDWAVWGVTKTVAKAKDVAFSAFATHILALSEGAAQRDPSSSSDTGS